MTLQGAVVLKDFDVAKEAGGPRRSLVKEFTGISDPYEPPADTEILLDDTDLSPSEAAQAILLYLERHGFIGPAERGIQ